MSGSLAAEGFIERHAGLCQGEDDNEGQEHAGYQIGIPVGEKHVFRCFPAPPEAPSENRDSRRAKL